MGLDFGYTCGDIDRNIKNFKEELKVSLNDMIYDASPLLEGAHKDNFVSIYFNAICETSEDIFEGVRKTNEDIRKHADKQIKDLEDEISDLNSELEDKNKEIEELNERLNDTIDEYQNEIDDLKSLLDEIKKLHNGNK